MGAAEELASSVGTFSVWFPSLIRYHTECIQAACRALDKRLYEAAYRRGRNLGLDEAVAYALGESKPESQPAVMAPTVTLTKRERQVAELVAQGLTNSAIASRLVISPRTAQGHVEHILPKLGFPSRAQIAGWFDV
ncbi:response regulator transcription factor [Rhodococcus koreensis]|nr:helix-turn-helix transcriptional regulator [Rhodococcus koreensis]